MKQLYTSVFRLAGATGLLLGLVASGWAQAPVINSLTPMANANRVARNSSIAVGFSQALTPASAAGLKVFSAQRGGLRSRGATPAIVSGNNLSFAPTTYPFLPGEKVNYTITQTVASSGGTLAQPRVRQFTTAVGGTGQGTFTGLLQAPTSVGRPRDVEVGDIDGDGDLDLLAMVRTYTGNDIVMVRRNDGLGNFTGNEAITQPLVSSDLAIGDLDGDGDLDLAVTTVGNQVTLFANNGSGTFTLAQQLALPATESAQGMTLGDLDGDGDLDMFIGCGGNARISRNDGTGNFGFLELVSAGDVPKHPALGDVDGDGDLDVLFISAVASSRLEVRLNNGQGVFSGNQSVTIAGLPHLMALGDLDGDGDLDLLALGATSSTTWAACPRFNDGLGNFSGTQQVSLPAYLMDIALGDLDADGDLDLLACHDVNNSGQVQVRFNDGQGTFSGSQYAGAGTSPLGIALGDVDADGDLDLLTACYGSSSGTSTTVTIRLNGGTVLATAPAHSASLLLFPNPTRDVAILTGAAARAVVQVIDALGRPCVTATADAEGSARLLLPASMSPGVYVVRTGTYAQRLLIE